MQSQFHQRSQFVSFADDQPAGIIQHILAQHHARQEFFHRCLLEQGLGKRQPLDILQYRQYVDIIAACALPHQLQRLLVLMFGLQAVKIYYRSDDSRRHRNIGPGDPVPRQSASVKILMPVGQCQRYRLQMRNISQQLDSLPAAQ